MTAIIAAGALTLSACTSASEEPEPEASGSGGSTSASQPSDMGPGKADLGDVETKDDEIFVSTGEQEYEAYNSGQPGTNSTYNSTINSLMLSNFYYYGADGNYQPNEWMGTVEKTSDDPLTVEYTISDDAVWSDGTPITANDFMLQWASTNPESIFGEEAPFDSVGTDSKQVQEIPQFEVDGKSFTYVYVDPYPDWQFRPGNSPLPAHVVEREAGLAAGELAQAIKDGDAATLTTAAEQWNTIFVFSDKQLPDAALVPSSGPYTLEGATWNSPESITLVPNESYWGPAPATERMTFRFAAPETHVQALANGDLNVIEPQATADTVAQLQGLAGQVNLESYDQFTWEHFDLSLADDSPFADGNGGLDARRAFALCAPRDQIVNNLIKPINENAEVLQLREHYPFQDNYDSVVAEAYPGDYDTADIEASKAALAASGLSTPVDIRIGYSAPNQRRSDEVTLIKSSCDQAGFNVIDAGSGTFFDDGGELLTGDFEVALFAWAGSATVTGASFAYRADGGGNFNGIDDPRLDAAWDMIETTVDPDVIAEQKVEVEKIMWEELYTIPVFVHPGVVAYDARLQNVRPTASQSGVTWNAEQWVRAE